MNVTEYILQNTTDIIRLNQTYFSHPDQEIYLKMYYVIVGILAVAIFYAIYKIEKNKGGKQ